MNPDQLAGVDVVGDLPARVAYGELTVQVPREQWVAAVAALRDDERTACDFFDHLVVVDELADGLSVLCRLWSLAHRDGLLLRTAVPADDLRLDSLVGLFPGAAWAEREAHEMFGLAVAGHPDLRPLLLPDSFVGHPLRKDFVLASRTGRPWPGEVDPAGRPGRRQRRRLQPPGVPAEGTWGGQ